MRNICMLFNFQGTKLSGKAEMMLIQNLLFRQKAENSFVVNNFHDLTTIIRGKIVILQHDMLCR